METKDAITEALEAYAAEATAGDRHDLLTFAATKVLVLSLMAIGEQLGRLNDSLDSVIGEVQDRGVIRTFSKNSSY